MKLTGHKTEAVYRQYAIVAEADLTEGVEKLAALHKRQPMADHKVIPLHHRPSVAPEVTPRAQEQTMTGHLALR